MARNGAVRGFVLELAAGRYEHAGHHGQAAKGGGDHIAHHIAVVVLERPDEAALAADHPRHGVVDQGRRFWKWCPLWKTTDPA